jgi:hypothetical protein
VATRENLLERTGRNTGEVIEDIAPILNDVATKDSADVQNLGLGGNLSLANDSLDNLSTSHVSEKDKFYGFPPNSTLRKLLEQEPVTEREARRQSFY